MAVAVTWFTYPVWRRMFIQGYEHGTGDDVRDAHRTIAPLECIHLCGRNALVPRRLHAIRNRSGTACLSRATGMAPDAHF